METTYLVSAEERQRILALAQDLPTVWRAPTTTHAERKQLLRFLVKDVTLTRLDTTIQVGIRWQTEALTPLHIPRPPRAYDACRTPSRVVARIRELTLQHPDDQIATWLNQEGFTPGRGGQFTAGQVQWIRYTYEIPTRCPQGPRTGCDGPRGDGRYSASAAAQLLNVNVSTIADWCQAGILDGLQTAPHGPRWIKLTPEIIAQLRKPVRQQWKRHAK